MDLTKYFGEEGIVIDRNFVLHGAGKTSDDLLREMQYNGLLVNYLDTSGELTRVPVTASPGVRPDKGRAKSGGYVVNMMGDKIFATYGNWRTGAEYKFSSVDVRDMTPYDRQELQDRINEAKEKGKQERLIRYQEVADQVKERFKNTQDVIEHDYLTKKQIKSYGLRQHNGSLVVPVYSISGELRSLQHIDKKGEKRFVSASEVKGNMFLIGCDHQSLPKLKELVVVEGYATGATVYEATNKPVACVFSANFGFDAITKLRTVTNAKIIIAFDNDKTGLGQKKGNDIASSVYNCIVRIPSIQGDFNDLRVLQGLEQVKLELHNKGLGIRQYSIKNLKDAPPPREWLVENLLESSKTALLASIGGVGKSMLCLDLALKIAHGRGHWMNKPIAKGGNVVILSAEDDQAEVHRRVGALDPLDTRFDAPYEVFVLTVPDTLKPLILLKEDSAGLNLTAESDDLVDELEGIDNLELVVIDPVQSFVSAPITTSQEAGQLYCQFCASMASKFNASVLSLHHMSKSGLSSMDDPMSARASIRGSSSLVDGMRLAIALWLSDEEEAENICMDNGVEYDRSRVIQSAVVKANSSEVDMKAITLFRRNAVLEPLNEGGISWE